MLREGYVIVNFVYPVSAQLRIHLHLAGGISVNSNPQPESKPAFKNPFLYSTLAILFVAVYVGYVLLNRYESKREFEKRTAEQESEKRREEDRRAIEQLGGAELSIRALYVSPAMVRAGEPAQLCYDVANAKTVTLEPPVAEVWPSHSRCIDLKTKKSTTYTLSIADASGKTVSQSVELKVK